MGEILRKYATPLSVVAFGAAGITGTLMFFGIHNHQFNELHEWFGIAFVVIAILHLFRNAKGFTFMMSQARSWVIIGVLGVAAAAVSAHALTNTESGSNPYRAQGAIVQKLAQAPIAQVAPALGLSSGQAINRLRAAGFAVEGPGETIAQVAEKADKPAPIVFAALVGQQGGQPQSH